MIAERDAFPRSQGAKFRRFRRQRRLRLLKYLIVWAVGGFLLMLLLAAAVVGLSAGV